MADLWGVVLDTVITSGSNATRRVISEPLLRDVVVVHIEIALVDDDGKANVLGAPTVVDRLIRVAGDRAGDYKIQECYDCLEYKSFREHDGFSERGRPENGSDPVSRDVVKMVTVWNRSNVYN